MVSPERPAPAQPRRLVLLDEAELALDRDQPAQHIVAQQFSRGRCWRAGGDRAQQAPQRPVFEAAPAGNRGIGQPALVAVERELDLVERPPLWARPALSDRCAQRGDRRGGNADAVS